jgi:hypothetical protein
MKIIPKFAFLHTQHCITGSILHLFHFHDCPISEEMLLGLGEGVGFIYWHPKGGLPFLGGRGNTGRSEKAACLEVLAAQRCGVAASRKTTSSRDKAEKVMLRWLQQDEPLMIQVDMGFLPYFPLFMQYHFGYHGVVAAGYDPVSAEVTLADRDAQPYAVQLSQLMDARGSVFQPFPPQNAWLEYDFSAFHQPTPADLSKAIRKCADGMIQPPIRNLGVRGIQTAGQRICSWPDLMNDHELADACANVALYIRADAGTGGGLFRWMYARFLQEAAALLNESALEQCAGKIKKAGDLWEKIADLLAPVQNRNDLKDRFLDINQGFLELYELEWSAWSRLADILK